MNKKLIAIALASLPVAAMADVTIYGTMNAGVEHDTVTGGASNNGVHDYTSVIGFKGTEELGNGLKTIWQVENRIVLGGNTSTTGTNSSNFGSRQTFVGLDGGNLGTIRLGQINSSLKDLYAVDQWQYDAEMNNYRGAVNNTGANGLAVFTNQANRLKNAVRYDSATFYGFSGNVAYGFGENKNQNNGVSKASDIGTLGLNYAFENFSFHYAYQKEFNPIGGVSGATDAGSQNATTSAQSSDNPHTAHINYFEAAYNGNNLYVGVAYQEATGYDWTDGFSGDSASFTNSNGIGHTYAGSTPAALNLKTRQAALSAAYSIGAFTPKATYAKGWDQKIGDNTLSDTGYDQYILGVDYNLSKRTTAELAYGHLKFKKNATAAVNGQDTTLNSFAVSLQHNF
ncbi:MAG: porin [Paludibacterium sp.]|uniref:porin n=1 Tax=Paludibacterium sp. TaxID=1917523 RepID=UPI0025FF1B26|nr:porin [Paludibacterium sp.]MBV8047391.1 porin [Paludibacterium sp.]MBV8646852.1 porin [Paludibacterium sp.]